MNRKWDMILRICLIICLLLTTLHSSACKHHKYDEANVISDPDLIMVSDDWRIHSNSSIAAKSLFDSELRDHYVMELVDENDPAVPRVTVDWFVFQHKSNQHHRKLVDKITSSVEIESDRFGSHKLHGTTLTTSGMSGGLNYISTAIHQFNGKSYSGTQEVVSYGEMSSKDQVNAQILLLISYNASADEDVRIVNELLRTINKVFAIPLNTSNNRE